ncbi:flagellar basal body rod protein FlgC [Chthonobacter rhizosphaerae]|uniref:flagellar basal body rod protein FlgC n=1 Tax=Chthonobacter rhizosphaerae TaxID=2735553 RepID=UPI0015EEAEE7|nr:flagellar basal body rod protein FlgC [Chthonobacter rhizosphaerae]
MFDPLNATLSIASHGLRAQTVRLRVVSENLANAQSTGETAGAEPYRRKVVNFKTEYDRAAEADLVEVKSIARDKKPFVRVHEPGHPAADQTGYVQYPNVNPLIELADLREANRTYEANLEVVKQARSMTMRIIDLMRS